MAENVGFFFLTRKQSLQMANAVWENEVRVEEVVVVAVEGEVGGSKWSAEGLFMRNSCTKKRQSNVSVSYHWLTLSREEIFFFLISNFTNKIRHPNFCIKAVRQMDLMCQLNLIHMEFG